VDWIIELIAVNLIAYGSRNTYSQVSDILFMEESNEVFERIVSHLTAKSDYFIPFVERRMSNEKWVQGEILYVLRELKTGGVVLDYVPERAYPNRRERCDLYYAAPSGPNWVEMEAIVTNYQGGSGIPITNQVGHVIEDAERVREWTGDDSGYLFFFAYPFSPQFNEMPFWNEHLERILSSGPSESQQEWNIVVNDMFAIYLGLLKIKSESTHRKLPEIHQKRRERHLPSSNQLSSA
jgi:hypothetical protein